jgi:hypothetical protein
MPILRIKARFRRRRRTSDASGNPRTGRAPQTHHAAPSEPRANDQKASADANWQAIVKQLLATPSNREPYGPRPDTEYNWARRLRMHINRPPRRS